MLTNIIRSARAASRSEVRVLAALEAASVSGWDAESDEPLDSDGQTSDLLNFEHAGRQPGHDVTSTSTRTTS